MTISEAADAGQNADNGAPQGDAYERVKATLLEFSWSNYGLDAVEDVDSKQWATDLAAEIYTALSRS